MDRESGSTGTPPVITKKKGKKTATKNKGVDANVGTSNLKETITADEPAAASSSVVKEVVVVPSTPKKSKGKKGKKGSAVS